MDNFEAYEYVIKPKSNPKTKLIKVLLVALYIFFVFLWLVFAVVTRIGVPLLALIPVTTWMLVFATWRYSNVEYEYSVASGVITVAKIYGSRSRKKVLELDIRFAENILPLGEKATERFIDDFDPQLELSYLSSRESENAYAFVYTEEDGTRCVICLEVLPMLMKSCKMYNSAAMKKLG